MNTTRKTKRTTTHDRDTCSLCADLINTRQMMMTVQKGRFPQLTLAGWIADFDKRLEVHIIVRESLDSGELQATPAQLAQFDKEDAITRSMIDILLPKLDSALLLEEILTAEEEDEL